MLAMTITLELTINTAFITTDSIWKTVLIIWITFSNHWSSERTKRISAKELLQGVSFIELDQDTLIQIFFASCLINVFINNILINGSLLNYILSNWAKLSERREESEQPISEEVQERCMTVAVFFLFLPTSPFHLQANQYLPSSIYTISMV